MTKNEVINIIKDEELLNYNLFEEHEVKPEEVVIRIVNERFSVYTSDERNCIISEEIYDNESDAFDDFIDRLRADKILRKL